MATCEKCKTKYISKKCPKCNNLKSGYNEKEKKLNNKKIFASISILTISIISIILINYNSNPLIGEWNTKSNILGNHKIIFKDDSIETMGMISKVKYKIEDDRVIVTDELGIGTIIKIIDENTLESNLAGIKTAYKRIK